MNRTLRIVRVAALVTLFSAVIAGGALASPMQSKDGDEAAAQSGLSRLADHIEIMRILVAKSINEGAFSKRYSEATDKAREQAKKELAEQLQNEGGTSAKNDRLLNVYRELAVSGRYNAAFGSESPTFTSHTRGFYAKGVGVLFTTEVSTPGRLVEVKQDSSQQESKAPKDDAWEQAKLEAQGHHAGAIIQELRLRDARSGGKVWEIDSEYVNDAIDGVLEAVATHGSRIVDLPEGESIIVAMRFEGDQMNYSRFAPMAMAYSGDLLAAQLAAEELAAAEVAEAPPAPDASDPVAVAAPSSGYTFWSSDWSSTWRNKQLQVVVQVPKSAITQFGSGAISLDGVRQRATITQYATGAEDESDMVFGSFAR